MRKITTFLFASIMTASIAQAGVMVNLVQNADPAAGVNSFTVQLLGTEGDLVSTVSGFSLTGAHQVWDNPSGNGTSPNVGDLEDTFGNAAWTPFDTHMLALPGFNPSPNWTPVETNDETNPAGIDLKPSNPAFETFVGTAGMGSLRFTDSSNPDNDLDSGIAFLAPQPATLDFLQVVVPEGSTALLNMVLEDSAQNRIEVVDLEIGGGGGDDPILGGDPVSGTDLTAALQAAFDNRGPGNDRVVVEDAIMVMNDADGGLFADLGAIDTSDVTDNLPTIDTFLEPGSGEGKYNLVMEGPYSTLDRGTMIMGDIVITAANTGDQVLNYSFSAKIPEPSTVALSTLAFVGLIGFARRRK